MYVVPDLIVKSMVLALEANATLFPVGAKLHLYVNNVTPDKNTVLADLTELTNVEVPGYAPVLPAWAGTPVRKPDGSWEDQQVGPAVFVATGPPPAPQIVYGWYLTDAASAVLAGAGRFDVPFSFILTGDGFRLEGVLNVLEINGTQYAVTLDYEIEP